MINEDLIEFPETPITEETFIRQGWTKIEEIDEAESDDEIQYTYYYFILPLPKDNPDENCLLLISSCNDEHRELGLPKNHYIVEIADSYGLGLCTSEEQIEILYRSLTQKEIYDNMS